jgi:imidazolonepropionase
VRGLRNLSQLVTLAGVAKKDGRRPKDSDLSIIDNGAVIWDQDKIIWVGKSMKI